MTIDEKIKAIEWFCNNRNNCLVHEDVCPLWNLSEDCFSDNPDIVERNYNLCFPQGEQAKCTNDVTTNNNVDHPSHYNQGGIECIDAMISAFGKEAVENFCLCNAFKYVWRNRDKNGFEDIDKAIWYLNKIKELISNE